MCPDLGVWPELSEATVTLSILPPKSVCDTDKRLSVALQVIYSVCVHTLGWGGGGDCGSRAQMQSKQKERLRKKIYNSCSDSKDFQTDEHKSTRNWRAPVFKLRTCNINHTGVKALTGVYLELL